MLPVALLPVVRARLSSLVAVCCTDPTRQAVGPSGSRMTLRVGSSAK